jgi:SAM-dependent methyltransferase
MAVDETQYWEHQHRTDDSLDAVGWTGLGKAFNGWMYAVRRRVVRRILPAHVAVDRNTRVLDVGSGTGFYLDLWRELGAGRIEGSDLTENATRRLRAARPGVPIHRFDLGGDPEARPDGPFDAVSAMDMLFHITDDDAYARAIANLAALVPPGGHVVLTENLLDGRRVAGPIQVSRSEQEILGLLRAHGLEPVARAPMFVLLNGPVDSRNALLRGWWDLLTRVVSFREALGMVAGAILFPIELVAVRLARRGPSTKLLVCRRAGEG